MSAVELEGALNKSKSGQLKRSESEAPSEESLQSTSELDPEIKARLESYYHQSGTFPPKHLEGQSTDT